MTYPVINQKRTGERIKYFIVKEDYTVTEVSKKLGIASKSTLYKWMRGESLPSLDNLYALSIIFRVSINDLLVPEMPDKKKKRKKQQEEL